MNLGSPKGLPDVVGLQSLQWFCGAIQDRWCVA